MDATPDDVAESRGLPAAVAEGGVGVSQPEPTLPAAPSTSVGMTTWGIENLPLREM